MGPPGEARLLCKGIWVVGYGVRSHGCGVHTRSLLPCQAWVITGSYRRLPRGTKGTGHGTYPFKSLPPAEILWILKKGKSVGGPSWGTARRPLVSFNTARHGTFLGTQEANTGWNLTWFLRWRWLAQAKTSKNPLGSSGWPPDSMFGVYLASEAWSEEQWLKPDSWMGPQAAIQWIW